MFCLLPVVLLVAAALFPSQRARAQDGSAPDAARPDARGGEVHFGAGSCAAHACHGGQAGKPEAWRKAYKVWATNDKHAGAYKLLTNEVGLRIGRRLGIKDVTKADVCLTCHGTTNVVKAKTFDPEDGVSCELCHGSAEKWLGPHATPDWKDLPTAKKAEHGFLDLTTPKARVAACVRCHVAGKDRDITHDIMAAGHPPLSFDAAKFMDAMPPHWDDEKDLTIPTWVEGLKANAAAQLGHVARAADNRDKWPEFAVFDCYSCHHPIYTGSVYERADPLGKPGDLPLDLSSLRVLLIATGDEGLAAGMEELLRKTYRPGDDGRKLARFAADAITQVEALFADAHTYGRPEADRFLANLDAHLAKVVDGATRTTRFEMEQIGAAVSSLAPNRTSESFKAAWASLDAQLDRKRAYDTVACARLARAAIAAGK